MANEQNNLIVQVNREEVVDDGCMLVGDFMTPQIIQSQSSIVHPPIAQPNFQLKTNIIHPFKNGNPFYSIAEKIHRHTYLDSWRRVHTFDIMVFKIILLDRGCSHTLCMIKHLSDWIPNPSPVSARGMIQLQRFAQNSSHQPRQ